MPSHKWATDAAAGFSSQVADVIRRGAEMSAYQMTRELRAERDALALRVEELSEELAAFKAAEMLRKVGGKDLN